MKEDKDLPTSEYAELGRALEVFKVVDNLEMRDGYASWCIVSNEVPGGMGELEDYLKSQLELAMQDRDSDSDQCNRCSKIYVQLHKDDPRINAKWVGDPCDCNEDIDADVLVYDKI